MTVLFASITCLVNVRNCVKKTCLNASYYWASRWHVSRNYFIIMELLLHFIEPHFCFALVWFEMSTNCLNDIHLDGLPGKKVPPNWIIINHIKSEIIDGSFVFSRWNNKQLLPSNLAFTFHAQPSAQHKPIFISRRPENCIECEMTPWKTVNDSRLYRLYRVVGRWSLKLSNNILYSHVRHKHKHASNVQRINDCHRRRFASINVHRIGF